ncbi:MAG: chlorohydrolase, partial [Clostridia bacterium]|nr:chlorohydrolase [Clostridia bacterium]
MYIVGNGKLITFDPAGVDSDCGAVAVDGARIAAVGELDRIRAAYTDAEFIDAEGGIIMPALADLHSHSRYSLLRS